MIAGHEKMPNKIDKTDNKENGNDSLHDVVGIGGRITGLNFRIIDERIGDHSFIVNPF